MAIEGRADATPRASSTSAAPAPSTPSATFAAEPAAQAELRAAITAAYRRPEAACLAPLLELAALSPEQAVRASKTARVLVESLRGKARAGGIEGLIHEYALSSHEGVALMCLAEALLRIPDKATRDALIRDKISTGDWRAHVGQSPSMFVNAATWGLVITGRLTATSSESTLSSSLNRLIARSGEPIIRKGVDLAIRLLGEQFVSGRTIAEALSHARKMEALGFSYSFDMLGEAAMTAEDARHYFEAYESAIHSIGHASAGRGVYDGPGISIKLSALHPRYSRLKRERVLAELLPRLTALAQLAKSYDIGLNIDAEEADRLELSLDLLEALVLHPALSDWNGIGFVIQAYGKRCPFVIDWIVELASRAKRRIMVRLVKGAYWDTEIKRAQVDGLADYPVFTRKHHTDVCYLACSRKLLAAPGAIFPQFATHNAQTIAAILELAGPDFHHGQYQFQCLHGMGEPLYEEVVGIDKLDRPCRIYAPVGTHETLLSYLVRRLLENGANTSFVNRVADESVSVDELIADPVFIVRSTNPRLEPHPQITLPRDLFGGVRMNSAGIDLSDENSLACLSAAMAESGRIGWASKSPNAEGEPREVVNPANHRDVVGQVWEATPCEVSRAAAVAAAALPAWGATDAAQRASILCRAANLLEARMPALIALVVREAGKAYGAAIAEVREAIDYLRYYAAEAIRVIGDERSVALGPIVCISPWNFPLAIFTGQVAAALAAGNTVLAKPAEETPLIAAEAVGLLHEAGIPADVLQLLPGTGQIGAALVADGRVQGVVFTGSTSVARSIQRQLAQRLSPTGQPIPLIAETGGQNALVVDSSALAEQVVGDVIASAFDSAGQRCSALRILCLQEEVADHILAMLRGALAELEVGNPQRLDVDVGPVISAEARDRILQHIETMRARGHSVEELPLADTTSHGTFVSPTIIQIARIADVEQEVFGPVLHVLRYPRDGLDRLIEQINQSGYGLTFGLHTRIDETIARVLERIEAGNIYVNRNIIGAVVGVQPFGGRRMSGTGPKAGGPLYISRLLRRRAKDGVSGFESSGKALSTARAYSDWLHLQGYDAEAGRCTSYLHRSPLGVSVELPGPAGERNVYTLQPRGRVAALAQTLTGLLVQLGAIFAAGNQAVVEAGIWSRCNSIELPREVLARIDIVHSIDDAEEIDAVLFQGDEATLGALNTRIAARQGAIVQVQSLTPAAAASGEEYDLTRLLEECSISTNTAAAGGNASLMSIG